MHSGGLLNLGLLLRNSNRFEEALRAYRSAVAIYESRAPRSVGCARALGGLAATLVKHWQQRQRLAEGRLSHERSEGECERRDHDDDQTRSDKHDDVCGEALKLLERALDIQREVNVLATQGHAWTSLIAAHVLDTLGRPADGLKYRLQSLSVSQQQSPRSVQTAMVLLDVADAASRLHVNLPNVPSYGGAGPDRKEACVAGTGADPVVRGEVAWLQAKNLDLPFSMVDLKNMYASRLHCLHSTTKEARKIPKGSCAFDQLNATMHFVDAIICQKDTKTRRQPYWH